jgi:hypothetical protein
MNKYRLKESSKYNNTKSDEAKNGKSLVERFIESYFAEKEEKPPRKFILREKSIDVDKRIKPLKERMCGALQSVASSYREGRKPRTFILRELNKEADKRIKPLREYRYNAVQPISPYSVGDEVIFTAYGEQWQGKIVDSYHYGNNCYVFSIQNAENVETGEIRSFNDVMDGSVTQDVTT